MSTETDKKKDEGMEKRAVVNTDQEKKANAVAEERARSTKKPAADAVKK